LSKDVWTKYKVKGIFVDKVYGGIPADPEVIEGFLASKKNLSKEEKEAAKSIIEKTQDLQTVAGQIDKVSNIFNTDETGVFLNNYQIMGALKESMSIQKSVTSWRAKMQRGVRVMPPFIYLYRDGKILKDLDGFEQKVVHSEDKFGAPVTSLKRVAFIVKPSFEFEVWVGNDKEGPIMSAKVLKSLLEHIEVTGIGAMHSMGMGQCKLTLVEPETNPAEPGPSK